MVGGGLNQILGVEKAMQQFHQAVVWPQNLINQAKGLVGALQGNYNQIQNLMHIPVNSATLPTAQQLEQVLLSRNANQIGQTSGAYTALYGLVPAPSDSRTTAERDLRTKAGEAGGNPQTGRRGAKAWHPDGAGSFHPAGGDAGSTAAVGLDVLRP